jgi:hypothetical protein
MTTYITVEKVKEVIRLAERALTDPDGPAADPQRGGAAGSDGVTVAATPSVPQPAADWHEAYQRFLEDLPDEALDELLSLYRLGGGPPGQAEDAAAAPSSGDAAGLDRVAFLVSRPDLPRCLSAALERM